MPEIIEGIGSTCCDGAPLYKGVMSPIDTALTLICTNCHERDKKAEKKYNEMKEAEMRIKIMDKNSSKKARSKAIGQPDGFFSAIPLSGV